MFRREAPNSARQTLGEGALAGAGRPVAWVALRGMQSVRQANGTEECVAFDRCEQGTETVNKIPNMLHWAETPMDGYEAPQGCGATLVCKISAHAAKRKTPA